MKAFLFYIVLILTTLSYTGVGVRSGGSKSAIAGRCYGRKMLLFNTPCSDIKQGFRSDRVDPPIFLNQIQYIQSFQPIQTSIQPTENGRRSLKEAESFSVSREMLYK
eukprot:TRINITY_DN1626_c0_g1_i3.p6 TRINITY_DN1626_c0_g1~~TRINITY_DN1626_c0_g1_i3.p6  ORF type:complete len:107 (+),score=4.63 TRINITY_DN1626_c0_g1_i3:138-458(+)